MDKQPEAFRIWWALPFAVFVGLIILGLIIGDPPPRDDGTSYHPASTGYRGCYELLDELGFSVKRSRRLDDSESVRWLLMPRINPKASQGDRLREMERLKNWVSDGGRLVLATNDPEFARDLGLFCELKTVDQPQEPKRGTMDRSPLSLKLGKKQVVYRVQPDRIFGVVAGQPLVTVVRRGRGEFWLVHYPDLFTNEWIGQADNAVFICRLAEATLKNNPGDATPRTAIAVDEYFHGLRDRPSMIELLFTRPILWITLAALLLVLVLLWRNVPSFGPLRLLPAVTRRSKEEFLDAMALLLQRKQDRLDAVKSVRGSLLREMARQLGMPGDAEPEDVAKEAARQRGLDEDRVQKWLAGRGLPGGNRPEALVEALRELESIRNDFFSVNGPR